MDDAEKLAGIIFDWFASDEDGDRPYCYDSKRDSLSVAVDGYLNCKALASSIIAATSTLPPPR